VIEELKNRTEGAIDLPEGTIHPALHRVRDHDAASGGSAAVAGDGLIAAHLAELRYSVARLPDADDIVAEAADHLLEAVERLSDRRHATEEPLRAYVKHC
jgi:hypothetical protein